MRPSAPCVAVSCSTWQAVADEPPQAHGAKPPAGAETPGTATWRALMDSASPDPSLKAEELAGRIAEHFCQTMAWPKYDALNLELLEAGGVEPLVSELGPKVVSVRRPEIRLASLEAFQRYAPCASEDLANFARAASVLASVAEADLPSITSTALQERLEIGRTQLRRLCELLVEFGRDVQAGMSRGDRHDSWTFSVPDSAVYFRGVSTVEEFLERRRQKLAADQLRFSREADERGGTLLYHGPSRASLAGPVKYVDPDRIQQLEDSESDRFDTARLVQLCRELNACWESEAFLSTGVLVRMILDHVPPVFERGSFAEVAAHAGRSRRRLFQRLEQSARHIVDHHLHKPIGANETLPKLPQVDFRAEIDALLEEVAGRLRQDT